MSWPALDRSVTRKKMYSLFNEIFKEWIVNVTITIRNLRHFFNIEFYHLSLLVKKRAADEAF
jgi:hypothetical protein